MRWAGHMARVGEESGVYRVLLGNPEGRGPLGRPSYRWVDIIRMYRQEVGCGYMVGIDGWIILGYISKRWDVGIWTGLGWHWIETGGRLL